MLCVDNLASLIRCLIAGLVGVLGTQIFMGKLRHECFAMDDNG